MFFECPKCKEHLCHCGYEYRDMIVEDRVYFAAAILGVPRHAVAETLSGVIPTDHPLKNNS